MSQVTAHFKRSHLKHYRDITLLSMAFALLILAICAPSTSSQQRTKVLLVVDVTQSMNVQDMAWKQASLSRLEYTKQLLKATVKQLPCGTEVSLGIFFKTTTTLLFTPIESCEHYHLLSDTISHLDWRLASQGNSNIRLGLISAASLIKASDIAVTQVAFFTDGNEAPPLNVFTKTNMTGLQTEANWTIVGVGGSTPMPIPKLDAQNQVTGYWSTDAIKLNPASNVDQGGGRDQSVATEPYEYYLSRLDEDYLKSLAEDINARYLRAATAATLLDALDFSRFNLFIQSVLPIKQLLALAALLCFTATYITGLQSIKKILIPFLKSK